MDNYLNILERPEVFIPTAALIVIVLLVWAQLSARGNLDEDFNLVLGITWTYLAMLFALIAVAIFLYDPIIPCAKGFLVLSFLMTMTNVLISFVLIPLRLIAYGTVTESLTKVGKGCCERIVWIVFWLVALVGLIITSLSMIGILACYCSYIGIAVLGGDAVYAFLMIKKIRKKLNKSVKKKTSD